MGMMINRRRYTGKKGLLPSGYTQVKYIENTSTAYIETNYVGMWGDDITFVYKSLHTGGNFVVSIADVNDSLANAHNRHYIAPTNSYNQYNHGGRYQNVSTYSPRAKRTYRWYVENNVGFVTCDGNVVLQGTSTGVNPNRSANMFFFCPKGWAYYKDIYALGRIYEFYVKRDDVEICHLIPCVYRNNAGLYDLINKIFYTSPNGVAFIAGNPV